MPRDRCEGKGVTPALDVVRNVNKTRRDETMAGAQALFSRAEISDRVKHCRSGVLTQKAEAHRSTMISTKVNPRDLGTLGTSVLRSDTGYA